MKKTPKENIHCILSKGMLYPVILVLLITVTMLLVTDQSPPEIPDGTAASKQAVPASSLPDEEANPIDAFFDTYSLDDSTSSNMHMKLYNAARSDAWLAEMEHGYALLKSSINPVMEEDNRSIYIEQIDRSRESFMLYAKESSYLEAVAASGDVFVPDASEYSGIFGSAFGGYRLWLQGEIYRAEALRLYSMLESSGIIENRTDAFVFDAEAFLASAEERYEIVLTCSDAENDQ